MDKAMKTIVKIVETIDNWGREAVYEKDQDILDYLRDPGSLDTDDAVFYYEEGEIQSFCLLDDIIGTEVMVGNQKIYIDD